MADYKDDINNKVLKSAANLLPLRFRNAEIERATGESGGNVSNFLHNKKPVSDAFLKKFSEAFKIDLRQFGYTKGMERLEIKNPLPSGGGELIDKFTLVMNENANLKETVSFLQDNVKSLLEILKTKQ